jgi:hypothetical protein
MKFILLCLSFYLSFDSTSAFDLFNIQRQHQEDYAYDTDHRDSLLQEFEYDQDTYSQLDAVNPVIHNQEVNPRFRPLFQNRPETSSSTTMSTIPPIHKDNMPLIELNQGDEKAIKNTIKSSSLLQILTPKLQSQEPMSFGEYYFQRQLEAFFKHQHEKFPAPTRSFIKTGLR